MPVNERGLARLLTRLKRTPVGLIVKRMQPFAESGTGGEAVFSKETFTRALCQTCGLDEDVATVSAMHHLYDEMVPAEAKDSARAEVGVQRMAAALSVYSAGDSEKTCRAIFDLYCEDGRDYLTKQEFTHYLESSLQMISSQGKSDSAPLDAAAMSSALAENLFNETDRDHDEHLSYDEFHGWYSATMAQQEADDFTIRPIDRRDVEQLLDLKRIDLAHLFKHFAPFATEDQKLSQDAFVKGIFSAIGVQSHDVLGNVIVDPEMHDLATRLFYVFDKDGSNWVDYQELGAGMSIFCSSADPDAVCRTVFALYDVDNDNKMSLDELTHYVSSVLAATIGTDPNATAASDSAKAQHMANAVARQAFESFSIDVTGSGTMNFDNFRTFFYRVSGGGSTSGGNASTAVGLDMEFVDKVTHDAAPGGTLAAQLENLFLATAPLGETIVVEVATIGDPKSYPGATFELSLAIRGGTSSVIARCYPSPTIGYAKTVSSESLRVFVAASGDVPLQHVRIVACGLLAANAATGTSAGTKVSFRVDATFTLRGRMPKLHQMGMDTLGLQLTVHRLEPFVDPTNMSMTRPAFQRGILSIVNNGHRLAKDLLALRIIDRIFDIFAAHSDAVDENGLTEVSFLELVGALSVFCVADPIETCETVFSFFDEDRNGLMDADELQVYIRAAFRMAFEIYAPPEGKLVADFGDLWDPTDVADAMTEQCFADPIIDKRGGLTTEEFKRWFLNTIATSRHPDEVVGMEIAPPDAPAAEELKMKAATGAFISGAPAVATKTTAQMIANPFASITAPRLLELWPAEMRNDPRLTHLDGVRHKLNLATLTLDRVLRCLRVQVDDAAASDNVHPHGPRLLNETQFLDAMAAAYNGGIDDAWRTMHQLDFLIADIEKKQRAGVKMLWSSAGKYEDLAIRLERLKAYSEKAKTTQNCLLTNIEGSGSTVPRALDALTLDILKAAFKVHQPRDVTPAPGCSGTASTPLNRFVPLIDCVTIEELMSGLSVYHVHTQDPNSGSAMRKAVFNALDHSAAGIITKNDLEHFMSSMLIQLHAATLNGSLLRSGNKGAERSPVWGWDLDTETDETGNALVANPHDLARATADQACFEQKTDSSLWLDFADFSEWFCRLSGLDHVHQLQYAAQHTLEMDEPLPLTVTSSASAYDMTAPKRAVVGSADAVDLSPVRLSAIDQLAIEEEIEGRGHYAIPEIEPISTTQGLTVSSPAREVRKMELANWEELSEIMANANIDMRIVRTHLVPYLDAQRLLGPSKFKRGLLSAANIGRGHIGLRKVADRLFDIFFADAPTGLLGWSLPVADVVAGFAVFCTHDPSAACRAVFDAVDYSQTNQISEVCSACSVALYSSVHQGNVAHSSLSFYPCSSSQPELERVLLKMLQAKSRAMSPSPPGAKETLPRLAHNEAETQFTDVGRLYMAYPEFLEWWLGLDLDQLLWHEPEREPLAFDAHGEIRALPLPPAPAAIADWQRAGTVPLPTTTGRGSRSMEAIRVPQPQVHVSRHGSISINSLMF